MPECCRLTTSSLPNAGQSTWRYRSDLQRLLIRFIVEGRSTKQDLYICDKVDRLYLSKQGCVDVNILSSCYLDWSKWLINIYLSHKVCLHAIPIRCLPLNHSKSTRFVRFRAIFLRPTRLPFPATSENIPKLEQRLKEQFASTAFNAQGTVSCSSCCTCRQDSRQTECSPKCTSLSYSCTTSLDSSRGGKS